MFLFWCFCWSGKRARVLNIFVRNFNFETVEDNEPRVEVTEKHEYTLLNATTRLPNTLWLLLVGEPAVYLKEMSTLAIHFGRCTPPQTLFHAGSHNVLLLYR